MFLAWKHFWCLFYGNHHSIIFFNRITVFCYEKEMKCDIAHAMCTIELFRSIKECSNGVSEAWDKKIYFITEVHSECWHFQWKSEKCHAICVQNGHRFTQVFVLLKLNVSTKAATPRSLCSGIVFKWWLNDRLN